MERHIGTLLHLQGYLLYQAAVLHHRLIVDDNYLRPSAEVVDAHLEDVTVDSVEYLSVPACADHVLPSFLFDYD